jgi:hypothetical protein
MMPLIFKEGDFDIVKCSSYVEWFPLYITFSVFFLNFFHIFSISLIAKMPNYWALAKF